MKLYTPEIIFLMPNGHYLSFIIYGSNIKTLRQR